MLDEWFVWGSCGRCGKGVTHDGWLVWNKEGDKGTFACGRCLKVVKLLNPGGVVEELQ